MDFEVNRNDFHDTRINYAADVGIRRFGLAPGQIRLNVERFAFTTNNITYAVAGDMLDYWGFFPTESPWGRLPAMGLGSVIESAHPDIATGGRYFGFYPMSSDVVIRAEPHGEGFRDVGEHRTNHAATYTQFRDVASDPMFRPDKADEYLLLWGLFMTSYLADDHLADHRLHGATRTLVTSASSKTSISLAARLALRDGQQSVGLTSERNRAFVERLGLYDEVITYDEIGLLDAGVASGMVDMAGSASVRASVHEHFADHLKFSLSVGITHWEDQGGRVLPGPQPEFFFAPGQSAKRIAEWGPDELARRIADAFHSFLDDTDRWLKVTHRSGPDEIVEVHNELLEGRSDPAVGYVVSLSNNSGGESVGSV